MSPVKAKKSVIIEDQPPPSVDPSQNTVIDILQALNMYVPGLLALVMVLTYCFAVILGRTVDDKFIWAISIILSFYFGSKRGPK
jgi:hypothetical protein